jgi:hypothetical protein
MQDIYNCIPETKTFLGYTVLQIFCSYSLWWYYYYHHHHHHNLLVYVPRTLTQYTYSLELHEMLKKWNTAFAVCSKADCSQGPAWTDNPNDTQIRAMSNATFAQPSYEMRDERKRSFVKCANSPMDWPSYDYSYKNLSLAFYCSLFLVCQTVKVQQRQ